MDVAPASRMGRERQERLIEQLTHDNGVLKRKVAGFQLAVQVGRVSLNFFFFCVSHGLIFFFFCRERAPHEGVGTNRVWF